MLQLLLLDCVFANNARLHVPVCTGNSEALLVTTSIHIGYLMSLVDHTCIAAESEVQKPLKMFCAA